MVVQNDNSTHVYWVEAAVPDTSRDNYVSMTEQPVVYMDFVDFDEFETLVKPVQWRFYVGLGRRKWIPALH